MLRRLYAWTMREAAGPRGPWVLGAVSFAESSFFPLPPDLVLIPLVAARPERAWRYAALCTLASVLGGMLGYAIGYYLSDVATWLLRLFGAPDALRQFQALFDRVGVWVILVKGFTPIPYKLITIAAGLAGFSFPVFVAASVATRGARFFLVAWAVKRFGPTILPVIERRLYLVGGIAVALLVAVFVGMHFLGV